jgi:hypothetical protein
MRNSRIVGVQAEIRTEHLPNISLKRYHYTILLVLYSYRCCGIRDRMGSPNVEMVEVA